ncbi:MAG: 4Fe-4S binding protein, partial [Desulfovibrionaceae bacterium]|nr:4Fe-4S binding protein [Desulfovibrionaceae bacterium]
MWKKIRLVLALLFLIGCSLLFLDLSEGSLIAKALAPLAKIQLVPALLFGSFSLIVALLALTWVYGRIYCSVVCPLGLLQDLLISLKKKRVFHYIPAYNLCRYIILLLFLAGLLLGIPLLLDLFEPYSNFGRIMNNLGRPLAVLINNGLAWLLPEDNPLFQPATFINPDSWAWLLALGILFILLFLSLSLGRVWCGSICPVGTFLGFIARFALFRPRLNPQSCTHCGQCERVCKANCIDAKASYIDTSRCLACFNCQDVCRFGALTFTPYSQDEPNSSRRQVLTSLAVLAGALSTKEAKAAAPEGGLVKLGYKERRAHPIPLLPAGALSLRHFSSHCTGCQLCVANCPHKVLKTSDLTYGLFQPSLSFE